MPECSGTSTLSCRLTDDGAAARRSLTGHATAALPGGSGCLTSPAPARACVCSRLKLQGAAYPGTARDESCKRCGMHVCAQPTTCCSTASASVQCQGFAEEAAGCCGPSRRLSPSPRLLDNTKPWTSVACAGGSIRQPAGKLKSDRPGLLPPDCEGGR
eukprot:365776-Chlamydomonas_euryale.AAC.17